jgi:hypothetical protein
MRRLVLTKRCHYTAPITLLEGIAKVLSIFRHLSERRVSGWGASGIDDVHMDGTPKHIITFMEGQKR